MSDLLTVNNIEVIYDHVILVLKGVSLSVPEGGEWGWQDHHAKSNFQFARGRTGRCHQRLYYLRW